LGQTGSPRRRLLLSGVVASLAIAGASVAVAGASLWIMSAARADWPVFSTGDPLVVFDPDLGYVPPPHSITHRRHRDGVEYSYFRDGRGSRADSRSEILPSSVDLLFIGGSFTLGRGVEHDDTFAALAASELGLSMANLGTGAYGTVQSLLRLERHSDLSPRVVIYAFIDGHISRNLSACAPSFLPFCTHVPHVAFGQNGAPFVQSPGEEAASDWLRNQRFVTAIGAAPLSWSSLTGGFQLLIRKVEKRFGRSRRDGVRDPARRRSSMAFLLDRMQEVTQSVGAHLLIAYIPDLELDQNGSGPPPELLLALRPPIELVDLSVVVQRRGAANPPLAIPDDGHPSRAGHEEIARGLVDHLANTRAFQAVHP